MGRSKLGGESLLSPPARPVEAALHAPAPLGPVARSPGALARPRLRSLGFWAQESSLALSAQQWVSWAAGRGHAAQRLRLSAGAPRQRLPGRAAVLAGSVVGDGRHLPVSLAFLTCLAYAGPEKRAVFEVPRSCSANGCEVQGGHSSTFPWTPDRVSYCRAEPLSGLLSADRSDALPGVRGERLLLGARIA